MPQNGSTVQQWSCSPAIWLRTAVGRTTRPWSRNFTTNSTRAARYRAARSSLEKPPGAGPGGWLVLEMHLLGPSPGVIGDLGEAMFA